jgi:hypothetical protein
VANSIRYFGVVKADYMVSTHVGFCLWRHSLWSIRYESLADINCWCDSGWTYGVRIQSGD